ncbi:MAG: hypothetical protein RLZZ499_1500 [Cyanobacteriota bacterium]|jgi:ribosomal-protein-alanine N-acetyltransferase
MSLRVFIRKPVIKDWQELVLLHQKSKGFHFPWVFPSLTEKECKNYIRRCQKEEFEGLLICHVDNRKIVGVANFSQIIHGFFHNAFLGYYVSVDYAGQGLMIEGISLAIDHAFHNLALHRIEANIQPENIPSIKLVQRLGFTKEGFSRRYLKINGEWCDHERWALTVEDWL